MEIFLNLVWALLAMVCLCVWMRYERRTGAERRLPIVALALLLIILFPVISVSDDLWSIQNPAETDTCQRRDHVTPCTHALLPALAAPLTAVLALFHAEPASIRVPSTTPTLAYREPALGSVENRPPPVA